MAYTMSKLTRIIFQLSDQEYEQLYHSLVDGEALKSADLLKILREEQLEESSILERLDVSSNAYYALRSRLNNKIESFYSIESKLTVSLKNVMALPPIMTLSPLFSHINNPPLSEICRALKVCFFKIEDQ